MCSLSEVIRFLDATVDSPTQLAYPLEWPIEGLNDCLKHCCRTTLDMWRVQIHRNSSNHASHNSGFREIQSRVDACLNSASKRTRELRQWTRKRRFPDRKVRSYRHLVILALTDVRDAFKHFWDLREKLVGMLFEYIKKCYHFMICIGRLLFPHDDGDNFFAMHLPYLVEADLDNFKLNQGPQGGFTSGWNHRKVPLNPTLAGQIMDGSSIPAYCLPRWPQPPLVVRTRGPYDTALSRNAFQYPQ